MFNDFQVLRLTEKHLIRILARLKHARPCARVHLRHLLGHLAGRYVIMLGVGTVVMIGVEKDANRTVIVAQEEDEDGLQSE